LHAWLINILCMETRLAIHACQINKNYINVNLILAIPTCQTKITPDMGPNPTIPIDESLKHTGLGTKPYNTCTRN
jgi:hypothetical protein